MSFLLSFCIVLALIPQALSHGVCEFSCTAQGRCKEDKSNQKMILTEKEKVVGLCAANEFCDGDIRGVDCKCTSCPVGLTNCCRNTLPSCYCQPDQCKCQDTISTAQNEKLFTKPVTIKSTSTNPGLNKKPIFTMSSACTTTVGLPMETTQKAMPTKDPTIAPIKPIPPTTSIEPERVGDPNYTTQILFLAISLVPVSCWAYALCCR